MATYTPAGNILAAAAANPTLKSASETLNVSGRNAPVRTMVRSTRVEEEARKAAVSMRVSVPWVRTRRRSGTFALMKLEMSLLLRENYAGKCTHEKVVKIPVFQGDVLAVFLQD